MILTMRTSELQLHLLKTALSRISEIAVRMSDLNDRNAHRFINVGDESALAKAIAAYATILGNVRLSWGDDERDALEMVDALSNEWDNLFNAVGQRLRNHKPLENARNALVPVSERLEEIIRSPIGTRPRNDSKDIIRNFIITLSTLQEAMIFELANYSPLSLGSPFSQEGFERAKRGKFAPKTALGSALEDKIDELRDTTRKTQEIVMRIDARDVKRGKQQKENDRQDKCFSYWETGRQNQTIRQNATGKVTYEDVFNYYKRELEEIGVRDAAEFRQLLTRRSKRLSNHATSQ